jgi:hypothetical protein
MKIVACEDRVDLRTIVSKSAFLNLVCTEFNLKNGQAVCFTNKAMTRFRLVFKVSNVLFMCIPEIDEKSQYSVYLKISETLAKLAGIRTRVKFDFFAEYNKKRIKRQDARKKSAKKAKRAPRKIYLR